MRRISRWAAYAALSCSLAILGIMTEQGSARADVSELFNLSGNFDNGSILSGTLTIDVTSGSATAIDAVADGFAFKNVVSQSEEGATYMIFAAPETGASAHFFLSFPVGSLVDYAGGSLTRFTRVDDNIAPGSTTYITSGSVSRIGSPVPEPSSWALLIVGFVGVGLFTAHRARRATITASISFDPSRQAPPARQCRPDGSPGPRSIAW